MPATSRLDDTLTSHPTGQHWVAPAERLLFGSPPRPPEPLPEVVARHDAPLFGASEPGDRDSTTARPLGQLVATSPQSQVRLEGYALLRDLSQDTPTTNR